MITYADFHAKCTAPEPVEGQCDTDAGAGTPVPTTDADDTPTLGQRLETVCGKAVDKLDQIMELPLDPAHRAFAGVLRAQTTAANTALTVQAKVDDLALRRAAVDRMPEILKMVAEVQRKLPPPGPIDLEANYGVTDDT
jgi:hypothetical protein